MSELIFKKSHIGKDNYFNSEFKKKQIIVGNTFGADMIHLKRWKTRLNGKYKQTAPYTITLTGDIHIHYNPKHHSECIGIDEIDRHVIPIVLENEGWLIRDLDQNGMVDWIGDIYKRDDEPIRVRWRNHEFWAPYTEKQEDSLVKLCKYLCDRFDIPLVTIRHNTKVDSIENFEGVAFKSNYSNYFSDLSPAFDFVRFKNKLELK